jgi:hypothetical protein
METVITYKRSDIGWGNTVNVYCRKQWAVLVNGLPVRNAAGNVRTFATSSRAAAWAQKHLEAQEA